MRSFFPIILLIFSALLCVGMVSAGDDSTEEALYALSEERFDGQTSPPNQFLFKIDFTVDLLSSYPINVTLTPVFYGFGAITEDDIVSWQWIFSDGRQGSTTTMIPISVDFVTSDEYSIQLIACTHGNVCETAEGTWAISDVGILACPFDPDKLPTPRPTPAPIPTPTKNPKLKFSTAAAGVLFQTGPVYVYPNTVVQLQISEFEYDIVQIQWDYGDGTSSGWVPADKNKKTSHTYTTPGVYSPVVTVRNIAVGFQLSSEDIDEHRVIVQEPEVITPSPTPIAPPPTPPQTGFGYLPLPNMKGPQADLDGDGLVDDFNGDGKTTAFDVTVFFEAYMKECLSLTSAYDYNQNEKLEFQDIVVFYDRWNILAMV